jgi:hypothetical protein
MAQQFSDLKIGDRFYYENFFSPTASFSISQLNEIRKITVARLVCDNIDSISSITRNPFFLPDPKTNPSVSCSEIPTVDYSVFNTSAWVS